MNTAGFVLAITYQNLLVGMYQSLGATGEIGAALSANSKQFVYPVGHGHQSGDLTESLSFIVQVETGGDDLLLLS